MATCATLDMQKVSAIIYVGSYTFATYGRLDDASGYVMSFNINRNRNQSTATLQFVVDAWMNVSTAFSTSVNNLGDRVVVMAGTGDDLTKLPTLFTGYVMHVRQRPNFDDSRRIILEFSAEDVFVKMKAKTGEEKFTRRFRLGDEAFAVITGGQRRQGGQLTLLHEYPAGGAGISSHSSGSSMGSEHSPLIKTPDPQHLSPKGSHSSNNSSNPAQQADATNVAAEPPVVQAGAGSTVFVQIIDKNTGQPIDVAQAVQQAGQGCCLHCNPPPRSFDTGASNTKTGLIIDSKSFPVSVTVGSDSDPNAKGFTFKVTGSYPFKITFVHPTTGALCTITFDVIPPHDHRDISRGGPAVGSYDVFQI